MKIYTIHSNSDEDEAALGLEYGYFTSEDAVIDIVNDLREQADDPEDDTYHIGTLFWYNAYSPNETAEVYYPPSAG